MYTSIAHLTACLDVPRPLPSVRGGSSGEARTLCSSTGDASSNIPLPPQTKLPARNGFSCLAIPTCTEATNTGSEVLANTTIGESLGSHPPLRPRGSRCRPHRWLSMTEFHAHTTTRRLKSVDLRSEKGLGASHREVGILCIHQRPTLTHTARVGPSRSTAFPTPACNFQTVGVQSKRFGDRSDLQAA